MHIHTSENYCTHEPAGAVSGEIKSKNTALPYTACVSIVAFYHMSINPKAKLSS